jgi:hypothetical protein
MSISHQSSRYPWVRRAVRHILIWALIAAGIVGAISAMTGTFGAVTLHAFGTIALFAFFALVSWYDADVSAQRSTWFAAMSAITSIFLLIFGLVQIWSPHSDNPASWIGMLFLIRIALLHIHMLLTIYDRFATLLMTAVSRLTVGLVTLLTVLLSVPLLFGFTERSEGFWRAVATIAILDALGTILVPLVHALLHRENDHGSLNESQTELAPWPDYPLVPRNATEPKQTTPAPAAQPPTPPGSAQPLTAQPPAAQPQTTLPLTAESYDPSLAPPPTLRLAWPRYVDGRPVPRLSNGNPDFTGVIGA